MIQRNIIKALQKQMKQFPAVAILGARHIGKSTVAKQIADKKKSATVYFDLEKPSDRRKLEDAETMLAGLKDKLVIIDEVQTMPELFTILRPLIDEYRKPGRFLLLGSVSPFLIRGISESLAGRIAHIKLPTINLIEADKANISQDKLWFRGGYPEALTLRTNTQWYAWAENYYRTFVERDVNFLMNENLSPATVRNVWTMLSAISGNIVNYENISRSLGVSRATVLKYLDFMEGAFLIRRLQPWFINTTKRIVKSPKIYFRDSGLLHYMNRIQTTDELAGHIVSGASWEGFVIEQIHQLAPSHLSVYYYRTHHGAESDVVLVSGNIPVACIEIKRSNAPEIPKGFFNCIEDLKTKKNFIITPSSDNYTTNNIQVCSLHVFLTKYITHIQ